MRVADRLLNELQPAVLLITLGELGMLVCLRNGKPFHIPTIAQEVFDVVGQQNGIVQNSSVTASSGPGVALKGEAIEILASELPARLWQHEVDHLHGRLFIDMMGPIGRMSSKSVLKEFEREYKAAQKKGEIESDEEIRRQLKEWEKNGIPTPPVM